jgi:hypothetical protein
MIDPGIRVSRPADVEKGPPAFSEEIRPVCRANAFVESTDSMPASSSRIGASPRPSTRSSSRMLR